MTQAGVSSAGGSEAKAALVEKKTHSAASQPLLPPALLVAIYFFVVSCTGQFICAADPIQEMLKLKGVFSHIDDPLERENAIKSVVGVGMSFLVIAGLPVGLFLDLVGPKITALCSIAVQAMGVCLIFFSGNKYTMMIGSVCMGCTFQGMLNSRMSVTVFFPNNMSLVLAIIGAAPEMSLILPNVMLKIAVYTGVDAVIIGYLALLAVCACIDLAFVPSKPFDPPKADDLDRAPLMDAPGEISNYGSSLHVPGTSPAAEPKKKEAVASSSTSSSYWDMSMKEQLCTMHFWIFVPFFVANFCRRKHFVTNIRSIFVEVAGGDAKIGGYWADAFNMMVPIGFIPAVLWGVATDFWGISMSTLVANIFGVCMTALAMVCIVKLQALTIVVYLLNSAYVFGLLFAFIAATFGFKNFATLQGICCTVAGLVALGMDAVWNDFITHQLNSSFFYANAIVLVIGLLMFVTPVYLLLRPVPKAKSTPDDTGDGAHRSSAMYSTGQIYERRSIAVLHMQSNPPKNVQHSSDV